MASPADSTKPSVSSSSPGGRSGCADIRQPASAGRRRPGPATFGRSTSSGNHAWFNFAPVETMTDERGTACQTPTSPACSKILGAVIPPMSGRLRADHRHVVERGRGGFPNLPAYISAKWGLIGLVKGTAWSWPTTASRVNGPSARRRRHRPSSQRPTYGLLPRPREPPTWETSSSGSRPWSASRPGLPPARARSTRAVLFLPPTSTALPDRPGAGRRARLPASRPN